MDLNDDNVRTAVKEWREERVTNDVINKCYRLGGTLVAATDRSEACMSGMFLGWFLLLNYLDSGLGTKEMASMPKELKESFTEAALNENDQTITG